MGRKGVLNDWYALAKLIFPPARPLLTLLLLSSANPNDAFWLAQTHFLVHQYQQAEKILTALRPPPAGPAASSSAPRRLTDSSLACRYLAAQCQVRLGKWEDALEMVGRSGGLGGETEAEGQGDGGIKVRESGRKGCVALSGD